MACEVLVLGGAVQGVGFRPFVYRLALLHGVSGWVRNEAGTVRICASAAPADLALFRAGLFAEAPQAARPILRSASPGAFQGSGFAITESTSEGASQGIPPDLGPCPDCLAELAGQGRRHRYPFINCTQCGPRYSIIGALPYDRPATSMAAFRLCPDCAAEYADPADRRFHAEPTACPDCGPELAYGRATGEAAFAACLADLERGKIVAVKGVGGYHLFCDAADSQAVAALRSRKHRPEKPFALLLPESRLRDYVAADEAGLAALRAPCRPILLLPRRAGAAVAENVAPGLAQLGVMLPDSPLHHLLAEGFGKAFIATSANRASEPILADPMEAEQALAGIADGFLHHDRRIVRPVEDSIQRIIAGAPRILRAGRGLAPIEIPLPFTLPHPVLALGGQMKSAIALGFGRMAVLSPHLGELESPAALDGFVRMGEALQALYGVRAALLLADAHPGYAGTRWARTRNLPVQSVWHHHAHASALAGEYGEAREMLVFTWDGAGLGPDGNIWGGEVLAGRPGAWRIAARLSPLRLAGGDRVAREPWRSAAALCWQAGITPPPGLVPDAIAEQAWQRGLNCHASSSAGRLFDAAAALLGLCRVVSYEGQAPMLLEAAAGELPPAEALPLREADGVWEADSTALLPMLLDPVLPIATRAAWFHATLAATGLEIARRVGLAAVGLAGGVFQNRMLAEELIRLLREDGFTPLLGEKIPCNDGGLAFGQIIEHGAAFWTA